MATAYSSPVQSPVFCDYNDAQGRFSRDLHDAVNAKYYADVRAWLKASGFRHALTGKLIRIPWADSYAEYMIANGTTLLHMPLMDAWHVPDYQLRGLRVADLKAMARDA